MSALHSGHLAGALLLIGGVVLSVAAIRARILRMRRMAGFLRAEGRVVEVENRDDPVFVGELYVMVVRFKAASGEETSLRFSRRDGTVPQVGESIPILYPADAPARGEAEGWPHFEAAGVIAISVLMAVLGAVLLWVSGR